MANVNKRPIVIEDLNDHAVYIAEDNLDVAEKFLTAAEATFLQIGNFPSSGKLSSLNHPHLLGIRQRPVKGFEKYIVFYRIADNDIKVLRVLHGSRNLREALVDSMD